MTLIALNERLLLVSLRAQPGVRDEPKAA